MVCVCFVPNHLNPTAARFSLRWVTCFFRTTVNIRLVLGGEERSKAIRFDVPLVRNRSKVAAGPIFHGGNRGESNAHDCKPLTSIATTAVASCFKHDNDARLSNEFHSGLSDRRETLFPNNRKLSVGDILRPGDSLGPIDGRYRSRHDGGL